MAWVGRGIGHCQGRRLVLRKDPEVGGQCGQTGRAAPSSHERPLPLGHHLDIFCIPAPLRGSEVASTVGATWEQGGEACSGSQQILNHSLQLSFRLNFSSLMAVAPKSYI